jgi:hypothetical protein
MGHVWVVDADLKSYFDTIPHDRLLALVTERVADGRVLALVERFQQAGVLEEAKGWQPTARGTPQGGVISPLLANLYLHPLDHQMEKAGWEMVRYADTPIEGRFTESFHDSRIAHRGHEPAQRRSADSLVRELVEVGSRGQSCPRSGQRFMGSVSADPGVMDGRSFRFINRFRAHPAECVAKSQPPGPPPGRAR